ncbi:MAG: class I SAM-dependent RNA methyltransferase [Anaerolineales bacterium]|nr:class I SAM-dependent RNA methyltransferase [Anaerolineales bacterium]
MDKIIEISLDAMVYGGDCLGRLPDGRAVFVPYALPGEKVRVEVTEQQRGHARAVLLDVLEASPRRVQPRCPHYQQCGGCHYQHIESEAQLQIKADILCEQLRRIGGFQDIPLLPAKSSPQAWNYRNHVQFHLDENGRLGFQAARSAEIVPIQECHLPEEILNWVWPQIEFDPLPGLERVGLRLGADEDVMLILESSDPAPVDFTVEELSLSAVHLGPGGVLILAGSDAIMMEVLERSFRVSASSFFQVNTAMATAMVEHVLSSLELTSNATVLDVYCGVGLFSAFLAPKVKRLVGIETSPDACDDFAVNLDEFDHVELYEAPAENVLTDIRFSPDAVLVDPPRSGLGKRAMDGVLTQGAPRLVYVSCDPATLARDGKRLVAGGYRLESLQLFDLFPQTYHIESISVWGK